MITSVFADESIPIIESGDEMVLGPPRAANKWGSFPLFPPELDITGFRND